MGVISMPATSNTVPLRSGIWLRTQYSSASENSAQSTHTDLPAGWGQVLPRVRRTLWAPGNSSIFSDQNSARNG